MTAPGTKLLFVDCFTVRKVRGRGGGGGGYLGIYQRWEILLCTITTRMINCSDGSAGRPHQFTAARGLELNATSLGRRQAGGRSNRLRTSSDEKFLRMSSMALEREGGEGVFVGCLTSQQQASVPQGRICTDTITCCHTEIEVADQTIYLIQSQYTDTGPTSPSADLTVPGAWQGSHCSANF